MIINNSLNKIILFFLLIMSVQRFFPYSVVNVDSYSIEKKECEKFDFYEYLAMDSGGFFCSSKKYYLSPNLLVLTQLQLLSVNIDKERQIIGYYNKEKIDFTFTNSLPTNILFRIYNGEKWFSNFLYFTVKPNEYFWIEFPDQSLAGVIGHHGFINGDFYYKSSDYFYNTSKRVKIFRFFPFFWKNAKLPDEISWSFWCRVSGGYIESFKIYTNKVRVNGERISYTIPDPIEYDEAYSDMVQKVINEQNKKIINLTKISSDKYALSKTDGKTSFLSDGIISYGNKWISTGRLPVGLEYNFYKKIPISAVMICFAKYGFWGTKYINDLQPDMMSLVFLDKERNVIASENIYIDNPIVFISLKKPLDFQYVQINFPTNCSQSIIRIHEIIWFGSRFPPSDVWNIVKMNLTNSLNDYITSWMDLNMPNDEDKTLLEYALDNSNYSMAEELIKRGAILNPVKKYSKDTLIHIFVKKGNFAAIKYLIEHKVPINDTNNDGNTALHIAALSNRNDIILYLIENGADIYLLNRSGESVFQIVLEKGNLDIVRYLVEKRYVDLNKIFSYGRSALHLAAESGNYELVKYLIIKGLKVNSKDDSGRTPLVIAIINGKVEVVKLLLDYKADVNIKTKDNETPLIIASRNYNKEIIYLLVQHNADLKSTDYYDGKSPLHYAAEKNDLETVKLLVESGADVKALDNKGLYPVIYTKNNEIKRYLLKKMKNK